MPPFTRTNFAHDETILFDSGRGKIGFAPSPGYSGMQQTPHDNNWSDGTPSFLPPVSHYHLLQEETFYVAQGSGTWILNGKATVLTEGDTIKIPARSPHRFESIPNAAQKPLIVWHRYDPGYEEMEEKFTRNMLCYLWDCKRAGTGPSVMQICVFVADAWIAAEVIKVPGGGGLFVCLINTVLTFLMAMVGLLLGYKKSYPEYYDPVWSAQKLREHKDK